MLHPRVEELTYRLVPHEGVIFEAAPAMSWSTDEFRARLENDTLSVHLVTDFDTEEGARRAVEPLLRACEISDGLKSGEQEFHFEYQQSRIVDRGSSDVVDAGATLGFTIGSDATAVKVRHDYPTAPSQFVVSPDVETMWNRWQGYKQGREPLASMAYMCLTVLEASMNERDEVAKRLGFSGKLLDTFGYLVSEVGDAKTGRKGK